MLQNGLHDMLSMLYISDGGLIIVMLVMLGAVVSQPTGVAVTPV